MGQAEYCVEVNDFSIGVGFFRSFSQSPLRNRFIVFHESGRDCPHAGPWINCALAKKHLVFMNGQTSSNNSRVLVVNTFTYITHISGLGVTLRYTLANRLATTAAKFHIVEYKR
jgi:hypothetical protein